MISQQILSIKDRLLSNRLTQIDLVNELNKSGRYASKSSLKVQVNYLVTGKRFNETTQKLLEHILEVLDGIENGTIVVSSSLTS